MIRIRGLCLTETIETKVHSKQGCLSMTPPCR